MSINLLVESKSRDVITYPNPYDFELIYDNNVKDTTTISDYVNPISNAYPITDDLLSSRLNGTPFSNKSESTWS